MVVASSCLLCRSLNVGGLSSLVLGPDNTHVLRLAKLKQLAFDRQWMFPAFNVLVRKMLYVPPDKFVLAPGCAIL